MSSRQRAILLSKSPTSEVGLAHRPRLGQGSEPPLQKTKGYMQSKVGWSSASSRGMGSVLCKTWLIGPSGVVASFVQNAVGKQSTVERPTREHQSRRWLNARV